MDIKSKYLLPNKKGLCPFSFALAGMGDIQHNIEKLALDAKLFINTVDPNMPILPQLPDRQRKDLSNKLSGIFD